MADFNDHDDKVKILNLVQDSVVPLSKTILVVPREFLAAWRPRVARQRRDLRDDPSTVLLREGLDLPAGRRLDEQPIACHDAEGPSRPPRNQGVVPWPWPEMRRDRRHPLRGFAGARRSPDRKQTSPSPLPSCEQLDGGRRRGRWSPAWSSAYDQRSVITSQRQLGDHAAEHPNGVDAPGDPVRPCRRGARLSRTVGRTKRERSGCVRAPLGSSGARLRRNPNGRSRRFKVS